MKELKRIESREVYPYSERPHYNIKLTKGEVTFYLDGKEMPDDKIGDVIVQLTNALNAAEKQIDLLFTLIQNNSEDRDIDFTDYLEEYPIEEDYRNKYRLDDVRGDLFFAMMKKDEKSASKLLNEYNILSEKIESKKVKEGV